MENDPRGSGRKWRRQDEGGEEGCFHPCHDGGRGSFVESWLPEGDLFIVGGFLFSWSGNEVQIEDEVEGGALFFVEDGLEVFAPKFGGAFVFLGKKFCPLTQSATRLGAFAEFFEPVMVGFHEPGRYSPEN